MKNLDSILTQHFKQTFSEQDISTRSQIFSREGFVKIPNIVNDTLKQQVHTEIKSLLDTHSERRNLTLATTDHTPRYLSIVKSEVISKNSPLLMALRSNPVLLQFLKAITQEELHLKVTEDEEFVITKQEFQGDTHGWHWGDYSFALIWIVDVPAVAAGGMLQCIPHTRWNKDNAQINQYLCDNPIKTYSFVPGDIYLLKADTTLHRTVPLTQDCRRVMLNMTWASERDYAKLALQEDDRWWENIHASKAHHTDPQLKVVNT